MSLNKFIDNAMAAGAEVVPFESTGAAVAYLNKYLGDNGVCAILVSPELKTRPPFRDEFSWAPEKPPAREPWADVGVVAADYGIAETGTLVRFDRSDDGKNAWTLPEVCFCFLERSRVVPALDAIAPLLTEHLGRTDLASPQVSLVTGPSRTADIENQLTIGVHGPSRLIILLI